MRQAWKIDGQIRPASTAAVIACLLFCAEEPADAQTTDVWELSRLPSVEAVGNSEQQNVQPPPRAQEPRRGPQSPPSPKPSAPLPRPARPHKIQNAGDYRVNNQVRFSRSVGKPEPWWQSEVVSSQSASAQTVFIDVQSLIMAALRYSHNLQAERNLPLIREDYIIEAAADFDTHAFMDSKFTRISEPVGNSLTTGADLRRLRDSIWNHSSGIRKRYTKGGRIELSQRVGYEDSNSDFFQPPNQGTARLALRFDQPLLHGAGRLYNTSLIVLAEIDSRIAWAEFTTELQSYLLDVSNSYWDLYLNRASWFQKQRNFDRAKQILEELEDRSEIDAAVSQLVRARAALAARKSDLARAAAEVRNSEAIIRSLVNDPILVDAGGVELVPREMPLENYVAVSKNDALVTALQNRPEIDHALRQIHSGRLHVAVSENELLPVLNAVTEVYLSGLRGESDIGGAWIDQYSEGEPSYSAGLEFSVPIRNRAAKAKLHRKQLQLRTLVARYRATVETLTAEVEVAVRDVATLFKESQGKYHAMRAAKTEADALTERWRLLPGDDRSASLLLEDILDAQDRLLDQEFDYASARVAYAQSLMNLKRVTGKLLQSDPLPCVSPRDPGMPLPRVHSP